MLKTVSSSFNSEVIEHIKWTCFRNLMHINVPRDICIDAGCLEKVIALSSNLQAKPTSMHRSVK